MKEKIFNKVKEIFHLMHKKRILYRYTVLCIALFVSACSYNLLQIPTKIVTGGTGGLALITQYTMNLDPSQVIFIVSLVLLIFSFIFLGIEKTSGVIVATFLFPLFVKITSNIAEMVTIDSSDMLLLSIFIGLIMGITNGFTFKVGFSNGGFGIISQILYKYKRISMSMSSFFINLIIVLAGGIFFGWTMVMYSIIILYINSIIVDKVLIGISKNKSLYIITNKETEVKNYIVNELKHGVTLLNATGGFLHKKETVLMTVIPNSEYFKLKEGIHFLDSKAFFIVTDSYQVYGGE